MNCAFLGMMDSAAISPGFILFQRRSAVHPPRMYQTLSFAHLSVWAVGLSTEVFSQKSWAGESSHRSKGRFAFTLWTPRQGQMNITLLEKEHLRFAVGNTWNLFNTEYVQAWHLCRESQPCLHQKLWKRCLMLIVIPTRSLVVSDTEPWQSSVDGVGDFEIWRILFTGVTHSYMFRSMRIHWFSPTNLWGISCLILSSFQILSSCRAWFVAQNGVWTSRYVTWTSICN